MEIVWEGEETCPSQCKVSVPLGNGIPVRRGVGPRRQIFLLDLPTSMKVGKDRGYHLACCLGGWVGSRGGSRPMLEDTQWLQPWGLLPTYQGSRSWHTKGATVISSSCSNNPMCSRNQLLSVFRKDTPVFKRVNSWLLPNILKVCACERWIMKLLKWWIMRKKRNQNAYKPNSHHHIPMFKHQYPQKKCMQFFWTTVLCKNNVKLQLQTSLDLSKTETPNLICWKATFSLFHYIEGLCVWSSNFAKRDPPGDANQTFKLTQPHWTSPGVYIFKSGFCESSSYLNMLQGCR